jgi:hypothetical protein
VKILDCARRNSNGLASQCRRSRADHGAFSGSTASVRGRANRGSGCRPARALTSLALTGTRKNLCLDRDGIPPDIKSGECHRNARLTY